MWLYLAGWAALHLVLLWYAYVLIMGLYRAHMTRKLGKVATALAIPALLIGYFLDWLANWLIASFVFLELPHKPLELVTDRLTRYLRYDDGWRYRWALWVCHSLLDIFDPRGTHCR